MTNTELLKAPRDAAQIVSRGARAAAATARPAAAPPARHPRADLKALLEIGFAVARVVELAILFA